MKKGCFVKVIVVVTILVAAITYIIQNKFNEYLLGPSKKVIVPLFIENLNENIHYVKDSTEKDSLVNMVKNYINNAKDIKSFSDDYIKEFMKKIQSVSIDSVISKEDLKEISNFIKARKLDERSTEN